MSIKILSRFFLFFFLALPLYAIAAVKTLTVLQTSDLHCQFTISSVERLGGIINKETVLAGGRDKTVVIDSGDLIQGSFAAVTLKGKVAIDFLNLLRYDIWTPGNHDLDFGYGVLKERIRQFRGKTVMGNFEIGGALPPGVEPFVILERNGLRVAVIGLTFPNLWRDILPNEPRFQLQRFSTALERIMPQVMRQAPDIIILNAHYGLSMSYGNRDNSLTEIARRYPQINLICGGHTHQINGGQDIGYGVWYTEPGKFGQAVAAIRLEYDTASRRVVSITSRFIPIDSGTDKIACPEHIKQQLQYCQDYGNKVVGNAAAPISGSSRGVSNPLQNLFGQAIAAAAEADAALISPAREHFSFHGEISEKELYEAAPYDDTITLLDVTPEELRRITAEQLGWKAIPQRQLPWGFRAISDQRAKNLSLQLPGNPARLKVAVNSFIIKRGKNWFPILAELDRQPGRVRETGIPIRDALRDYIKKYSPLQPDMTKWLVDQ